MKAISLWQPWASAIACGSKKNETRSWPAPKGIIGTRIAIHAAARKMTPEEREYVTELRSDAGIDFGFEGFEPPYGCIVATAVLAECRTTDRLRMWVLSQPVVPFSDWREYHLGNYDEGRFAWRLEDVQRLEVPIKCIGRQGFWNLEHEVERALLEVHPSWTVCSRKDHPLLFVEDGLTEAFAGPIPEPEVTE